ncbi:MAG TPA: ABC transporter permease [candidate division Zixibacteria bacterium]|nr:ABC transporter permease [candidate division Zixibacteria bacterium]
MSVFKGDTNYEKSLSSTFDVTFATVKRNLITDWQYKSDIVIQLLWTLTNLIAYGFLGLAVGTSTGKFAPPYDMSLFLLSSSVYWTLFTGNYEETAFCLREEAARGTMGYLITNNVDALGIMVGRYISSSIKFFGIFLITTIPTFALVKNNGVNLLPHTALEFFMLVPLILLAYLFMLAISLFIGSITLLVKQTTTIVRIVLYLVRILAGYFFTIKFFGQYSGVLSTIIVCLPITTGQYALRKYLIEHNTAADFFGLAYWQVILINIAICAVLLVAMYFFVKAMTKLARKRGTIEFY